ncbi:CHAT domain-containing protein [Micromonospora sp. MH99]|uniref:CHAT domain-containing protein n=1 Tax=Micromonospora sp. MH99 TaxID=1945510 RepID=UPI001F18EC91|nr:CHAT domain-containing protein [Micromonospora sp. MH99]
MTIAVPDNGLIPPWKDDYLLADTPAVLEEYVSDVVTFAESDQPQDLTRPGDLYENLLFAGAVRTKFAEMRRTLAGRARIRVLLTGAAEIVDRKWEAAPIPRVLGGFTVLGQEPDVSLVRVVDGPTSRPRAVPSRRVVVATATDLSGHHLLPDGESVSLRTASGRAPRDAALIRDALQPARFEVVTLDGVTKQRLRSALIDRSYAVVFCGHHVAAPAPGLLVHADDEDAPATAELLKHNWVAANVTDAKPALAVLVACGSGEPVGPYGSLARRLAEGGVPLVVGIYGTVSHYDAEQFVATFFEQLVLGTPADLAVAGARSGFSRHDALPVLYTHGLAFLDQRAPAPELPTPDTYQTWALTRSWSPGTSALPVDDARRVGLDLICTLDRGPATVVLADAKRRSRALGDALTAAEETFQHEATRRRRTFARRRWYEYEAANNIPDTAETWLQLAGNPPALRAVLESRPDGATLGLVVTAETPATQWEYGGEWAKRIAMFAAFRDAELPGAALVLRIVSPEPLDAVLAAQDVAARLDGQRVELLCHVLPWTTSRVQRARSVLLPGDGPAGFGAAVAEVRQRYGLDAPTPPVAGGSRPTPIAAAVQALVAAVNADSPGLAAEVGLLLDVRDWLRDCYEPLLAAYARDRAGPGRYAALIAAAATDDHLDHWLDEAIKAGRPPLPDEAPAQVMRTEVVDALLWALHRRRPTDTATRDLIEGWLELRDGESVQRLMGTPRAEFGNGRWAEEDPAVVRRWARAVRLGPEHLARAFPDRPGYWAALSQMPLKPELVERVLTLDPPFPLVVGLSNTTGSTGADVTDADLVAVLRHAYLPPNRPERA